MGFENNGLLSFMRKPEVGRVPLHKFKEICVDIVNRLKKNGVDGALVEGVITWLRWLESKWGSEAHVEFFFSVVVLPVSKTLLSYNYLNKSDGGADNTLFICILKFLCKRLKGKRSPGLNIFKSLPSNQEAFSIKHWNLVLEILDPSKPFFNTNGGDFPTNGGIIGHGNPKLSNGLGNGKSLESKNGEIESVSSDPESSQSLSTECQNSSSSGNVVRDDAGQIQDSLQTDKILSEREYLKKTEDWRRNLVAGDMLDLNSSGANWVHAVVLNVIKNMNFPSGIKDSLCLRWPSGIEEFHDSIVSRGTRFVMAPLNTKCSRRNNPPDGISAIAHPFRDYYVYDINERSDAIAVSRSPSATSASFLELIECFGHSNGFHGLLNMLKNMHSVDFLAALASFFSRIFPYVSSKFSQTFIPKLLEQFGESISKLDFTEAKKFKRETVNAIHLDFARIAQRVFRDDKTIWGFAENFLMDITKRKLASTAICDRLDALDILSDLICKIETYKRSSSGLFCIDYRRKRVTDASKLPNCLSTATAITTDDVDKLGVEYIRLPVSGGIDPQELANWILKTEVIETSVLGDHAHEEAVNRSSYVFAFLAKLDKLPTPIIRRIYTRIEDTHASNEGMNYALYDVACSVLPFLSIKSYTGMLKLTGRIPPDRYTERTCILLSEMCKHRGEVLPSTEVDALTPIKLLWKFSRKDRARKMHCEGLNAIQGVLDYYKYDSSQASPWDSFVSIHGASNAATSSELSKTWTTSTAIEKRGCNLRKYLLEECRSSMESRSTILSTLKVLIALLRSSPDETVSLPESRHKDSRGEILVWLNERGSMIEICIECIAQEIQNSDSKTSCPIESERVQIFFDWLLFVLIESNLVLSKPQMEKLWHVIFSDDCGKANQASLFFWFLQFLAEYSARWQAVQVRQKGDDVTNLSLRYHGLDTEALNYLFFDRLSSTSFWDRLSKAREGSDTILEAAFQCFQAYFLLINFFEGRVCLRKDVAVGVCMQNALDRGMDDSTENMRLSSALSIDQNITLDPKNFCIPRLPLQGQDTLWHIALETGIGPVSRKAATFLSFLQYMHSQIAPYSAGTKNKDFICSCFKELYDAARGVCGSNEELSLGSRLGNPQKVKSCLVLIRLFLNDFKVRNSLSCIGHSSDVWTWLEPHVAFSLHEIIQVNVLNSCTSSSSYGSKSRVSIYANEPIWMLLNLFGDCVDDIERNKLCFFVNGKELDHTYYDSLWSELPGECSSVIVSEFKKESCEMERALNVRDPHVINKQSICRGDRGKKDIPSMVTEFPNVIIASNSQWYELLFSVLDICIFSNESSLVDELVGILGKLPPNSFLRLTFLCRSPSAVLDLLQSLDSSSSKLVYILEMLEAKLSPAFVNRKMLRFVECECIPSKSKLSTFSDFFCAVKTGYMDTKEAIHKSAIWCEKFASGNGFQLLQNHLFDALSRLADLDVRTVLHQRLLLISGKLMKIIFDGLVTESISASYDEENILSTLRPDPGKFPWFDFKLKSFRTGFIDRGNIFPESLWRTASSDEMGLSSIPLLTSLDIRDQFQKRASLKEVSIVNKLDTERLSKRLASALGDYFLHPADEAALPDLGLVTNFGVWGLTLWTSLAFLGSDRQCIIDNHHELLISLISNGLCCMTGRLAHISRQVTKQSLWVLSVTGTNSTVSIVLDLLINDAVLSEQKAYIEYFSLCEDLLNFELSMSEKTESSNFNRVTWARIDGLCDAIDKSKPVEKPLHVIPVESDVLLQYRLKLLDLALKLCSTKSIGAGFSGKISRVFNLIFETCLFGDKFLCHRVSSREAAFTVAVRLLDFGIDGIDWSLVAGHLTLYASLNWEALNNFLEKRSGMHAARPRAGSNPSTVGSQANKNSKNVVRHVQPGGARNTVSCVETKNYRRSETGFVGLINPGYVCYLISLLQQLFMVPEVRRSIFAIQTQPIAALKNLQTKKSKGSEALSRNQAFIVETQRLFAYLGLSVEKAYNPTKWSSIFGEAVSGFPIDIWQQDDAHQFFLRICDLIDEAGKQFGKNGIMSQILGTTVAHQLLCVDEKCTKEELERFQREMPSTIEYCISVEISEDCDTLEQSLSAFVEGEVLNDFSWGKTPDARLRTLKRQCFQDVNDVFFIHINRFKMNWETFMPEKINSRFEFPMHLDLFPYMKEGLAWKAAGCPEKLRHKPRGTDYYCFNLVGVVIHSGENSNCGHYYSLIRSNSSSDEKAWFHFNDREVRKFDPSNLPAAAFGGLSGSEKVDTVSEKSAYMLVYRREAKQVKQCLQDKNVVETSLNADFCSPSLVMTELSDDEDQYWRLKRQLVPQSILKEIDHDNDMVYRVLFTFCDGLRSFLRQSIDAFAKELESENIEQKEIKINDAFLFEATRNVLVTLPRASETSYFTSAIRSLAKVYTKIGPSYSRFFLDFILGGKCGKGFFISVILSHSCIKVREAFADFCIALFSAASVETWDCSPKIAASLVHISYVRILPAHMRMGESYFRLLTFCAQKYSSFSSIFLAQNFLPKLIDIVSRDVSYTSTSTFSDIGILSDYKAKEFLGLRGWWSEMINCVEALTTSVWPLVESSKSPASKAPTLRILSQGKSPYIRLSLIVLETFLEASINHAVRCKPTCETLEHISALETIVKHCAFESRQFSEIFTNILLVGISRQVDDLSVHLKLLRGFLLIEDSLQAQRIKCFLIGDMDLSWWRQLGSPRGPLKTAAGDDGNKKLCLVGILQQNASQQNASQQLKSPPPIPLILQILEDVLEFAESSTEFRDVLITQSVHAYWMQALDRISERIDDEIPELNNVLVPSKAGFKKLLVS